MNYLNIKVLKIIASLLIFITVNWLSACSSSVGGNEDRTGGTLALTSLNEGGEIVGTFVITWTNDEPNQSTVDIELSSDSGETYQAIEVPDPATKPEICVPDFQAIEKAIAAAGEDPDALAAVDTTIEKCSPNTGRFPDLGAYVWNTNTVSDCRTCRIRITATDVVGNVSDAVASAENFIINNVPQVLGAALFNDVMNDGIGDGDTIVIPFDKSVELNASVVGDAFFLPVLGDEIGPFSTMKLGALGNEIIITINDVVGSNFHLHVRGKFDATRTNRTAPSSLDILGNLQGEIIFSPETGRTAQAIGDGIDIVPAYDASVVSSNILAGSTTAVALADLDDNGTLDAVVINTNSLIVQTVYSGDGDGTFSAFAAGVQQLGNNFPGTNSSVAIGDVDGVNGLDLIVGNFAANTVYYNNSNDGDFITMASLSLGNSITGAVALGDIDNNGSLDLIAGNDGPNRVWRNNGSGVFAEDGIPQLLGTSSTTDIALKDIDGDGDLDLVTANVSAQANRVYTNNGSGVFTDSGQVLGNSTTYAIAIEDVDGDGDYDLVTGNDDTEPNRLWLNDGAGVFTDSGQSLGSDKTLTLALVDIDDDGDPDLITGNDNGNVRNKKVWFNDGAGNFFDSGQSFGQNQVTSIALGDLDGDHDIDILEGILGNSVDVVWLNSQRWPGQDVFIDSEQLLGNSDTRASARGDIDGDGDLDVVTANESQGNRIWRNDGKAVFSDTGQSLGGNQTRAIVLVDVDGDTDLDIVTGNFNNQSNRVWLNDGLGVFTDSGQSLGSSATTSIALDDIDNDNDLDLIVGNFSQANRIWRNNGSGSFSEDVTAQALGTAFTTSITLGDVDGDGDIDFVAGNDIGQPNQVWLNSGLNSGTFIPDQSVGTSDTQTVTLGDVDGDGDLDLATGNFNTAHLVWINDGSVSNMFTSSQSIADVNGTGSVLLRDIDGDGDRDLLVGQIGSINLTIINNGKGVFNKTISNGDPTSPADATDTRSMTTGDFDGDGDLDLFTGNVGGAGNQVWLNDF